jgi:hypothetical protein
MENTNLGKIILIPLICKSLLTMVMDVAPSIETKATGNNFYDMIDEGEEKAVEKCKDLEG